MKHLSSIVLAAAVVAAGAVACFKDPTSSLRNGASRILLTRSTAFLNVGDSLAVQAEVKDDQGNTFTVEDATWTTSDAAVAVVNEDVSKVIPYKAFSKAFVRTTGAGKATVYFTSHGLTDSLSVVGVPLAFNGTITNATSNVGDTITINGTAVLTFSTTAPLTDVTVDGLPVWIVSRTANAIRIVAPSAAAKTVHLTNVKLLGTITIAGLDATTHVTVTDNTEPANDSPTTPTAMTLYTDTYGVLTAADVDDYFRFTTTTADSVRFEVEWLTDADIDGYLLNATGGGFCVLDGCAAAGSSNPETVTRRLAAATTYQIDVNLYDAGSEVPLVYRIRTTKIQ